MSIGGGKTDSSYPVLVIEEDKDVAPFRRTVPQKRDGCEARVLYRADAALAAIREFRPDMLITDVELPGISGLDLLEQAPR